MIPTPFFQKSPGSVLHTRAEFYLDDQLYHDFASLFPEITFKKAPALIQEGVLIRVVPSLQDALEAKDLLADPGEKKAFREQGYLLKIQKGRDQRIDASLYSDTLIGRFYALCTLTQLFTQTEEGIEAHEVLIIDKPAFLVRGFFEGYYGPVWRNRDRLHLIDLLSRYKFNYYLYAPKDDLRIQSRWREPLDRRYLQKIRLITEFARERFVRVGWGIRPIHDFEYSTSDDYRRLVENFTRILDQGVPVLFVAFDDLGKRLSRQDRRVFKSYAAAQSEMVNRLFQELRQRNPHLEFGMVPNEYWGDGATGYLEEIGERLDPEIIIGWTGNQIISRRISAEDAIRFSRIIRRKPLLGDNYPVIDHVDGRGRIHVGPLVNRDNGLHQQCYGYVANMMPLARASQLAALTIADYTWNPSQYDPPRAVQKSVRLIAGDRAAELALFVYHNQSSPINEIEAPETLTLMSDFIREDKDRKLGDHYNQLLSLFVKLSFLEEKLSGLREKRLFDEMKPWISKLADYGRAGVLYLGLLKEALDGREDSQKEKELRQVKRRLSQNKSVVADSQFDNFISALEGFSDHKQETIP